ncbi:hypothetical protein AMC87_PD00677 (plasmid) [Rhizobium phaseoli]|uniref:Uncharacterized protein n=1 Tax=Rhizobium etli (strain CIAT 652) TaxID=491916 RepID=B3Q3E9_RHIE6|nr:hypothetical protein RHECIAT_PC0000628 [Rhizobium etli CIAT 652]ANL50800.1 hypothetical protein AMC87_PD00677 [Rhizobium phaseoli]PCD68852.1 hypothetical protein CO648_07750 [Rhizobium phaseoli]PDS28758.1 hypothetical protein CO650_24680 [Rhizobium phaseoli]PWI51468.1 hypothetical protein B5K03_25440 [Rhizobium phaseoli]
MPESLARSSATSHLAAGPGGVAYHVNRISILIEGRKLEMDETAIGKVVRPADKERPLASSLRSTASGISFRRFLSCRTDRFSI